MDPTPLSEDIDESPVNETLVPGAIVAGRFRVQRKLGEGGMGAVYAATNISTNRPVALKVIHPEYTAKRDIVRRFMREAKAATAISHPNVIEVLDVVDGDGGGPVMVMELLEGESLDSVLSKRRTLPLEEVARIMTPVVSAVGAAHARGIVHRDLKPDNIFLSRSSDGSMRPKVLDFGIAKILDPTQINEGHTKSNATRTGSMLGTPHYMSIEQACGEKGIDHRTDVWSVGVILYVMLSGRRPYEGDNFGQILKSLMTETPASIGALVPTLPPDVVDVVDRSMSRQRDKRPQDLREVYVVLARHCDATGITRVPSIPPKMTTSDTVGGATLAAGAYTSPNATTTTTQSRTRRTGLLIVAPLLMLLGFGGGTLLIAKAGKSTAAAPLADPSSVAADFSTAVKMEQPPPILSAPASSSSPHTELSPSARASIGAPLAGAPKTKPKDPETKTAPVDGQKRPPPPGGIIEDSPY